MQTTNSSFSGTAHTGIYLHTSSKYPATVTDVNNKTLTLNPGSFALFEGSNVKIACQTDTCPISFWHHNRGHFSAYYVNDAAGAVFRIPHRTLGESYTVYFDFGENTKILVEKMNHSRIGLAARFEYYDYDDDELKTVKLRRTTLDAYLIKSPVILQIRDSQYVPIDIRIIAGTAFWLHKYLTKGITSGGASFYDGATFMRQSDFAQSLRIPLITGFNSIWNHLEWFFVAFSAFIFISTIVIISVLIKVNINRKNEEVTEGPINLEDIPNTLVQSRARSVEFINIPEAKTQKPEENKDESKDENV